MYFISSLGCTLSIIQDIFDHFSFSSICSSGFNSDTILSCEAFQVAEETALKLEDNALLTPKADAVLGRLSTDQHNDVIATFSSAKGNVHTHILNEKISAQNKTIDSIKEDLLNVKEGILNCLVDNIKDQNKGSICHLTSAFNLASREGLESRLEKIKLLHKMYGNDQEMDEKWHDFDVFVTYKKKLNCLVKDLLDQFKLGY